MITGSIRTREKESYGHKRGIIREEESGRSQFPFGLRRDILLFTSSYLLLSLLLQFSFSFNSLLPSCYLLLSVMNKNEKDKVSHILIYYIVLYNRMEQFLISWFIHLFLLSSLQFHLHPLTSIFHLIPPLYLPSIQLHSLSPLSPPFSSFPSDNSSFIISISTVLLWVISMKTRDVTHSEISMQPNWKKFIHSTRTSLRRIVIVRGLLIHGML